ncbi:4-oxalocrotonate tautomerase family enzyme [Aliarcobacter faecis]|uniref:tautomerase family protein n=1 Tax=Aliarcobacter faecis TaxID=1564138 RepID=UPI000479A9C5|nr:4-oxalocrotonate tautomerase family protein [Aliarcobacter faecis]QKF73607.1 4-oxalocrotonate tautomerase family enzyme [Aliarcobacter faecis]
MPVINIKMTKEDGGATVEQKEELAKGITELFSKIFNRSSSNAVVLVEEFSTDNYYIGGKSVTKIRKEQK